MKTSDIEVARSVKAVEALRPLWASLAASDIDADIDFFLTVVQALPGAEPYVIHISKADGDLLVVARIEDFRLPFKLGYATLGHAKVRALVVAFDGVLGAKRRGDEELAIGQLNAALKAGHADIVVMPSLDVAGDRMAAARNVVPWITRGHGQLPTRRWIADIPDTLEAFLARRSATTRSTLRREERGFLKRFGDDVRLRRFDRVEEIEEAARDMVAVGARSYQHNLGAAFTDSAFDRALLKIGFEKGWARVWMLYLGERPVAFWSGTAYGKTFGTWTPGFDPDFAKDRVGRFTMFRMIEDLCKDPAISVLDFGPGEAVYKSRFGRPIHHEREVIFAAMRPWPLVAVWCHSLFSLANGYARRLVSSNGWLSRLKTQWRKRGGAEVSEAEATQ